MDTPTANHSLAGAAVTALFLEIFRLNDLLIAAGDRLTADIGLTSARWQVIGAIAMAGNPLTVSQIARNMGRARQSVQRVANELAAAGLISFADNPDHRRAKLVRLTRRGADAYGAAMARQVPWANALADGLAPDAVNAALRIHRLLRQRLEAAERGADPIVRT